MLNPVLRRDAIEEREFQTNIADVAKDNNTLVVLPTATGKTIIAAMVAAHFLYNYWGLKILVMAPTRPLVQQHRDTFLRLLKLRPKDLQVLTGEIDPAYRLHIWNGDSSIYFATPQVVKNDCELGLKLDNFSLLVFDECHRSKKKYAYTEVADNYIDHSPYPMILGLTASPGANEENIREITESLRTERIEARTKGDPDIAPYVNEIDLKRKYVNLSKPHLKVREKLIEMLNWRLEKLWKTGIINKPPEYTYKGNLISAGKYIRYRMNLSEVNVNSDTVSKYIDIWASALSIWHALDLLESQGPQILDEFLDRIKRKNKRIHNIVISEMMERGILNDIEYLDEHPKLEVVRRMILDKFSDDSKAKAIVFTQYRDTATHLTSELSKLGIPSRRFVGQANREGDKGLSQDEQVKLLKRLESGDLRVLVATSVGEEGLDIPSVDLVIFYEPVPSAVRYIQRKGRTGRKNNGEAIILAASGTHDIPYLQVSEKRIKKMRKAINGLNSKLRPLKQRGSKPEKSIIPDDVISEAESYDPVKDIATSKSDVLIQNGIKPFELIEEKLEYLEKENEKKFKGMVMRAGERALNIVLRSGMDGLQSRKLSESLTEQGWSDGVARAAIDRIKREGLVREVNGKIYCKGAADLRKNAYPDSSMHKFEIEKINRDNAIIIIDGIYRAELSPEEYDGPRNLIKKGSKFSGIADVYDEEGNLRVWIKEVFKS